MKERTNAMSEIHNDATHIRGSHNSHSNNKRKDSDNFRCNNRSNQNINVMKSDTYNIMLTLVAAMVIMFSIGAAIYTNQSCNHQINALRENLEDLEGKYDLLKELYITKGVE